ncbi:MAG TPA: methyltransferase domain-containing protein, partial [Acidimicrobiales bacterium]|nr:methyltransferase domain-containing protein [Acidimicrobiales bacterium]
MTDLDPRIREFYEQGREAERLRDSAHHSGPLEFARTQELILRFLPQRRLRILDVGGGPGAYALWLSELGHDVTLIDPVPMHVDQAASLGISASLG